MRRPLRSRPPLGFTMIETLVVIVIIALAAAVVVPRAFRSTDREAELAVDALAELVSSAARRDAYASQPLALSLNPDNARVELISRAVDPASGRAAWKTDQLTPAADVLNLTITTVTSDGVELDPVRFWYEFPQSARRPSLVIKATSPVTGREWTIELPSTGTRASVSASQNARPRDEVGVTDLDASGKADAPW
ncbi:MAG: type II secretion system protein [Phycisphaerales bacterium]